MNKGTVIILVVVVGVGAYVLGTRTDKNSGDGKTAVAENSGKAEKRADTKADDKAPADGIERYRVPVEGPSKGPANAKVTIVEFSDFQCPFCSRVNPTMEQIAKQYPNDVRMFFRHNPLPFHQDAPLAAEAAVAAEAQGKFWQMHDKLFANQQQLDRPALEKYAQEVGLNMAKFKADTDAQKFKSAIESETKEGQAVGVNGTPAVFINGRKISGAYPFETFKKIADEELAKKTGKKRG